MSSGKNYEIAGLIAQGGTAVLYKAIQTSLDRVVVVKKLHQHLTQDENFTRRFILEAKAAASLDHENIVKIIDFGVEDGTYFMVMEHIEGESFRDILDKWKQLPPDAALAVAHQICQGLEHAHSKGIVHRDIKPGNIMLTRSGRVKITDFGLAKLTQAPTQHTAANSILGTPLYMSPEQAFGEDVDNRSDIFSLGTMLYESLTGRQPFHDDNYMGVIQNIIHQNAPHPSRFDVQLESPVQSILGKAMNKSREARFQSAGDFREAIENYMGLDRLKEASENLKGLLATDGATIVLPRTERVRRKKRRVRKGLAAVVTAITVACAAAVGYATAPGTVRGFLSDIVDRISSSPAGDLAARQSNTLDGGAQDLVPSPIRADTDADSAVVGVDSAASALPDSTPARELALDRADAQPALAVKPSAGSPARDTAVVKPPPARARPAETMTAASDGLAASQPPPPETPAEVIRLGWLAVSSEPPAEVYIDGLYIGDTPATRVEVTAGSHTLECRAPMHEPYRETIRIVTGELSSRNIVLARLVGRVSLSTIEGAEVFVDGVLKGTTPLAGPIELFVGRHQITVKKAGYHVWNNEISLDADQLLPLKITLSPIY
ncbi:MAG: protein kinase [bacterium]